MEKKLLTLVLLIVAVFFATSCGKLDDPNNGENNNDTIVNPNNGGGETPVVPLCPEGAINGKFSINSYGKQVYFSKGNLQYQASSQKWRFAEKQWEYQGVLNESSFGHFGSDYWTDLFGWGTSGWENGNIYYGPEAYGSSNSEVGFGYGPTNGVNYDFDLTGIYRNSDWGVYNKITNGGNQVGRWRTLSQQEWQYLFFGRHTNTGARFAFSNVNGVNGVLLFPDNWDASLISIDSINVIGSYSNNTITGSSWQLLENVGVIFLPAAGYRNKVTVHSSGHSGFYWSVTHSQDGGCGGAYALWFYGASSGNPNPNLYLDHGEARCSGHSVRLVCGAN